MQVSNKSRTLKKLLEFTCSSTKQVEMITTASMKAGFTGGLVVDYPNSSKVLKLEVGQCILLSIQSQAKKFFLVLMTGGAQPLPAALGEETGAASVGARCDH